MNLTVQRRFVTELSTIGELFIDGAHECWTLEPPIKTDGSKPRAIPVGTFKLTIRHSERFGRLMPHVESVPGFDGILLHWGNFPKDTEGCTLIGTAQADNYVAESQKAFHALWFKLTGSIVPQTLKETDVFEIGKITYLDPNEVSANP